MFWRGWYNERQGAHHPFSTFINTLLILDSVYRCSVGGKYSPCFSFIFMRSCADTLLNYPVNGH